ncbi:hypothetical protein [Nocardia sp. NPDC020380]|uniref:hypothetical protein n=1 Tax=Nocardia sp. NPDC020380 TaxID=3364309 RepID=UPI0037B58BFA
MQKRSVRRGVVVGGLAGMAVVTALVVPAVANAAPADVSPSDTITVTRNDDGTVSVVPASPGFLPGVDAVPATPIQPGQRVQLQPGDGPAVTVAPQRAMPSTGSAG